MRKRCDPLNCTLSGGSPVREDGAWGDFVSARKGHAHALSDFGNALKALLHRFFAANLRLEDFPVVDAVLAGLAGVTDHDAALKLIEIDAQFDAMLTARRKLDGGGAAKSGRVVVLGARGNVDDDGLGVAADVNPILFTLPCSSKAIQRGANGHGHGAGAADAGARGGFGIGYKREAALRPGD